jgi:hypothetical protein
MTIRPAKLSDIPFLAEFWYDQMALRSQKTAGIRLAPDAIASWENYAREQLENERSFFLVAEGEGEILGGIIGTMSKNEIGLLPEQFGLIVYLILDMHSTQIQQNTAGALVKAIKDTFRQQELKQCRIAVASQSLIEQGFWRGLGANLLTETFWMDL